tara:strand:+ start:20031 stop:20327 length:297 start_codon:yes stop_codon:yes gene_type:complete
MVEKEQVTEVLKKVYDPEIQFDIYSLGLIYDVEIDGSKVIVTMTLTTPSCPYGDALMADVKRQVEELEGVEIAVIELTFSPLWSPEKMTEEARIALGM